MPHKRSAPSKASTNEAKRQKKFKTLQEKVELLDLLREKKSYAAVARHYGINESTVRYIKKNEAAIRSTVAVSFCDSAKKVTTVRNKNIVRMESALALWITDCRKKNIPLDGNIREKARKLYQQFATDAENPGPSTAPDPQDFKASKGWFDRFQKRFNIKSVSLHGEAASADTEAAQKYPETFRHMIEEKGYKPEQVFNMEETGLFWKKMPSRIYIMTDEAKAPGFKAQKDRVTLIMCGNAAGYMMKPGLIHKSANQRALKNKNKNLLPVYWMHNAKAWITKVLGSNWFHQCFNPQAKEYLHNLGMDFKVLLIMDTAGGHPLNLYYEGVQIEFLPANTTSLIQPMDQGVIRAFKALYTRNSLQHLVDAMDTDENFTIATCLSVIQTALKEMKKETLNACWKKLWPECVHDYKGLSPEEIQHEAVDKAVTLAKILGGEGSWQSNLSLFSLIWCMRTKWGLSRAVRLGTTPCAYSSSCTTPAAPLRIWLSYPQTRRKPSTGWTGILSPRRSHMRALARISAPGLELFMGTRLHESA
uniref:HTH CENPB-type domain-containing protein n=1 Tax=Leptobrachium leishanense TaxID=445787 RepID=A0A8C5WFA2_9ANUR